MTPDSDPSHPVQVPSEGPAESRQLTAEPTLPGQALQPFGAGGWQAAPPAGPSILTSGFDPIWLLHSLRRRWLLATGIGLLVGVACGALTWLGTPKKTGATVLFRVASGRPNIVFNVDQGGIEADFRTYRRTQMAMIRSNLVLTAALRRPGISGLPVVKQNEPDPVAWLQRELDVSYPDDGEIMQVSLQTEHGDDTRLLVEAVAEAFMAEVVQRNRAERNLAYDQLVRAYEDIKDEMDSRLRDFQEKANASNSVDSETAAIDRDFALGQLQLMRREVRDWQVERLNSDLTLTLLDSAEDDPLLLEAEVQQRLKADPLALEIQQQLYDIEARILRTVQQARYAEPPIVENLRKQQQSLRNQLAQKESDIRLTVQTEMEGLPNLQLQQLKESHEVRQEFFNNRLRLVSEEMEKIQNEVKKMARRDVDLEALRAEIDLLKKLAQDMGSKKGTWEVELHSPERVTLVQNAVTTSGISSSQRYLLVVLASVFGLSLTCLGIAYWDFRLRKLNGPAQMDEGLGIRVVGTLPSLAFRGVGRKGSDSVMAMLMESIDSVRTILMHSKACRDTRVVMVTSATSQEGRSTVASQLAASLARAGRRTLLVDGDLRHPTLHTLFDVPLEDGLCEVLRAEVDVADVVRPTHAESLWLVTAGDCDIDAIQALARDQVQPIFEKLKAEYDFVILDAAPLLNLSDSLIMGQYVDGAILSVLRDASQVPQVHSACELLKSVGVDVLGSVVNGVPSKPHDRVASLPTSEAEETEPAEA